MTKGAAGGPEPAEVLVVASTGRRFVAWLADLTLVFVAAGVVAVVLGGWHPVTRTMTNDDGSTWTVSTYYLDAVWSGSLLAFCSAIYAIPMWRSRGATLGQRLLGLRVLDAAEPRLLSWPRAAMRWFALFGWAFFEIASSINGALTVLIAVWLVVLLVSQMRDYRGQGIHDRLARSVVVGRGQGLYSAWS